jgi:hypothetical protein
MAPDQAAITDRPGTGVPWQFRLWHLFAAMSYVALCAAFARYRGWGTLLTTLGLGVAILNFVGCFAPLQTGRRQRLLLWLAWCAFLVSLCLPSVRVLSTVYGWEAAWVVLVGPWERILRGEFDPRATIWIADSLANLLLVSVPFLVWRFSRNGGRWYAAALIAAMPAPWLTVWRDDPMGLYAGFYVWCASFYGALLALPLRRGTLAAMWLSALAMILLLEAIG